MGAAQTEVITNQEREMVLCVADGNQLVLQHVFQIRTMCLRARNLNYWKILSWLIKNKITGTKFLDFLKTENHGSVLEMARRVRSKYYKDSKLRPLIGQYKV